MLPYAVTCFNFQKYELVICRQDVFFIVYNPLYNHAYLYISHQF